MWSRIFLFDKIRKITLTKGTFMGKHLLTGTVTAEWRLREVVMY